MPSSLSEKLGAGSAPLHSLCSLWKRTAGGAKCDSRGSRHSRRSSRRSGDSRRSAHLAQAHHPRGHHAVLLPRIHVPLQLARALGLRQAHDGAVAPRHALLRRGCGRQGAGSGGQARSVMCFYRGAGSGEQGAGSRRATSCVSTGERGAGALCHALLRGGSRGREAGGVKRGAGSRGREAGSGKQGAGAGSGKQGAQSTIQGGPGARRGGGRSGESVCRVRVRFGHQVRVRLRHRVPALFHLAHGPARGIGTVAAGAKAVRLCHARGRRPCRASCGVQGCPPEVRSSRSGGGPLAFSPPAPCKAVRKSTPPPPPPLPFQH